MPDREKIESLKQCLSASCRGFRTCPYNDTEWDAVKTVLELLEEQEPTTYAYDEYMTPTCQTCGFHPFIAYIPTLERMEQKGYNYCPGCGRRIKWDA